MHSEPDWGEAARQFQQTATEQWTKALQSFEGLGAGAGMPALPQLKFAAGKLESLQQAYVKEASTLWNEGIGANAGAADKRFAAQAWSANPVSAFSAAVYLLNA